MTTTDRSSQRLPEVDHLDLSPAPAPRGRRWTVAAGSVALAVCAVAAAAALGGSGSTQRLGQVPPAPSPASPVVADPAPAVPTADLVVDGVDTVRIAGFADRDGQVVVTTNRIRLLTGDEANAYAAARGEEVPVPNDQILVDDNPRLRDYRVRPDAAVTLTIPLSQDPHGEPTTTTLPELRQLLAGRADGDVHPFELSVRDGVVESFHMLYQP